MVSRESHKLQLAVQLRHPQPIMFNSEVAESCWHMAAVATGWDKISVEVNPYV
jgi:hypothetical protein